MKERDLPLERTLGSDTPLVWTKMILCMNFNAASFNPALALGDQTISRILVLQATKVSHMGRNDLFVHLHGHYELSCSGPRIKLRTENETAVDKLIQNIG